MIYSTVGYHPHESKDAEKMYLDQLQNFDSWVDNKKILEKVNIICFRRHGYHIKKKYFNTEIIMDFKVNISSAYIRQNFFKKNFNYSNYLNKQIYLYI